jgi:acyl dehydratase
MDLLYFEDFPPGEVVQYGDIEVSAARIKAFAEQFDPQPFHLDEAAARVNYDNFLNRSTSQGSPGIAEVNWFKPVRPGDRLSVRRTTVSARPSASKPDLGIVDFTFEVLNQLGEVAMNQKNVMLFKRRPAEEEAPR